MLIKNISFNKTRKNKNPLLKLHKKKKKVKEVNFSEDLSKILNKVHLKKFLINSKINPSNFQSFFSHSKHVLQSPLLQLNKRLSNLSKKSSKWILNITGEKKSRLTISQKLEKLLKMGLDPLNYNLKDEIYLQICKQLSNNPNEEIVIKLFKTIINNKQLFSAFNKNNIYYIKFPLYENISQYEFHSFIRKC